MSRGRRFLQSALETASLLVATDVSGGVGGRAVWSQQQRWMARATKKKHPVELLQDIEGLGVAGTVVEVSAGYARNYLIPGKLAISTRGKQYNSLRQQNKDIASALYDDKSQSASVVDIERLEAEKKWRQLNSLIKRLTTTTLTMKRKADSEGQLEEDIKAVDIADSVARQLQIEIVPAMIDMGEEVISTVGEYQIPLKLVLPDGSRGTLDVNVFSTVTQH